MSKIDLSVVAFIKQAEYNLSLPHGVKPGVLILEPPTHPAPSSPHLHHPLPCPSKHHSKQLSMYPILAKQAYQSHSA